MIKLLAFRHKSDGTIAHYPAHYATHPVFGHTIEVYDPNCEYEEDKVVVGGNELPVEQRGKVVATEVVDENLDTGPIVVEDDDEDAEEN